MVIMYVTWLCVSSNYYLIFYYYFNYWYFIIIIMGFLIMSDDWLNGNNFTSHYYFVGVCVGVGGGGWGGGLITIYYTPDSSGKSIVKCCKTKIFSFPFFFCSQGLNFQLAAVLFSLGFYSYVEYGEKTFNTLSVDVIIYCLE